MPKESIPMITALVCTRNRGSSIVATVLSILANLHPKFEVIVVDQSTNEETASAIAPLLIDPRLRYLRQSGQGAGRARNRGITEANSEIVVMTDDDCIVPTNWLETMEAIFTSHPTVAIAFSNVNPAPHDSSTGFIPAYQRSGSTLVRSSIEKCKARGIGASNAIRRKVITELGGFDELMGLGARFPSCDDSDIAVRAILLGYAVYETNAVAVEHAGFRTWEEGRSLARRNWIAIGASNAKPLKCGHWRFAVVPAYQLYRFAIWPPLWDTICLRRPHGIGRMTAFVSGFVQGWRISVDPNNLLFRPVL